MSGLQRWVLAAGLGCQGCAIIALVGENRDAGFDAAAVVDVPVSPPDRVTLPVDVPALPDAGPPAMDVAFVTDVPTVIDVRIVDRPGPIGAGQDVVDASPGDDAGVDAGVDVVVRADASATADAGMTMVKDGSALEDASLFLPDVLGGAPCRRDVDCARDPAGTLCGTMTMRCGTVR